MEKIGKYLLFGLMVMVLTACPPNCSPVHLDYGTLPAEALELVPYQDGMNYGFMHSSGQEIHFQTHRETILEERSMDPCGSISFEKNTTKLFPDYPVFDMELVINKVDTIHYAAGIRISASSFLLPTWEEDWDENYTFFDSLTLNGVWFHEVYGIRRHEYFNSSKEPSGIYPDSLWYNTDLGILRVKMSNEEYYQIL